MSEAGALSREVRSLIVDKILDYWAYTRHTKKEAIEILKSLDDDGIWDIFSNHIKFKVLAIVISSPIFSFIRTALIKPFKDELESLE